MAIEEKFFPSPSGLTPASGRARIETKNSSTKGSPYKIGLPDVPLTNFLVEVVSFQVIEKAFDECVAGEVGVKDLVV